MSVFIIVTSGTFGSWLHVKKHRVRICVKNTQVQFLYWQKGSILIPPVRSRYFSSKEGMVTGGGGEFGGVLVLIICTLKNKTDLHPVI